MKKKAILVTGAAGFLGSKISEELIKKGKHLVCLDNNKKNIKNLIYKLKPYKNNFVIFYTDICNEKKIYQISK